MYDEVLDSSTIFVLLAKNRLCWVFKISEKDGDYLADGEPIFVTQNAAISVLPVNDDQIAIQTLSGLVIVNLITR